MSSWDRHRKQRSLRTALVADLGRMVQELGSGPLSSQPQPFQLGKRSSTTWLLPPAILHPFCPHPPTQRCSPWQGPLPCYPLKEGPQTGCPGPPHRTQLWLPQAVAGCHGPVQDKGTGGGGQRCHALCWRVASACRGTRAAGMPSASWHCLLPPQRRALPVWEEPSNTHQGCQSCGGLQAQRRHTGHLGAVCLFVLICCKRQKTVLALPLEVHVGAWIPVRKH